MLLFLLELYPSILSHCKKDLNEICWLYQSSELLLEAPALWVRFDACGCGAAVVVDSGATLTNTLLVSYLLSVVYFAILY